MGIVTTSLWWLGDQHQMPRWAYGHGCALFVTLSPVKSRKLSRRRTHYQIMFFAALMVETIFRERNAKRYPKTASPRDKPPPSGAEIDYNKDWMPEYTDGYAGYKPWFIIDASEKFLNDVATTAAHYLL